MSGIGANRLKKEYVLIKKDPIPDILAVPLESNVFEWHFLIKGSVETDYEGGLYHGKLAFPREYPMKPPGILFFTPSGRFELNSRICMSMSDFHPESWNPMWSVSSILRGVQSFMNSDEITTGGILESSASRKRFASESSAFNSHNRTHNELFGDNPIIKLQESLELYNQNCKKITKAEQVIEAMSSLEIKSVSAEIESNYTANVEINDIDRESKKEVEDVKDSKISKSAKKRLRGKKKKLVAMAVVDSDFV